MKNAAAFAAVLFSVLVASCLGRALIRASSPTYDEPVHLAAGYTDLTAGLYRLNSLDHPPLGEMWAALPLLFRPLDHFFSHPSWDKAHVTISAIFSCTTTARRPRRSSGRRGRGTSSP